MRFDTKILVGLMTPALALTLGMAGCKSAPAPGAAPITDASATQAPLDPNADPAAANLIPAAQFASVPAGTTAAQPARVLGARTEAPQYTQQGENYAPQQQQGQSQGQYQGPDDPNAVYQSDVDAGQDALYANQAPPPLPVYEQPPAPEPNDQWNPGYWNYGNGGYYWVPGTWVAAPYYGALWTPPYWGYYGNRYRFHRGFWGLHIGFYGGIPYGFGYTGYGYEGGYWRGNEFYYNRAVNRIDPNIRNVYSHNVVVENNRFNRVSYNGGPGGLNVRPRPSELMAYREQRTPPMQTQVAFAREAGTNRAQFFSANHGQPQQMVHAQPVAAVRGIQAPQRGNFNNPAAGVNAQQRNVNEQQRNQNLEQRNVNEQQRNQNLQQRNGTQNQRNVQEQQRNAQEQQRNTQLQQRNTQQVERNQQEQQRNVQQQQRNVQEQQRNVQEQQRTQQLQQRNNQVQAQQQQQQRNVQQQQNVQQQRNQEQQRNQQQQRTVQEQQRTPQVQQRSVQPQPQQRTAPQQERAQPQPQRQAAPQPQHAAPAAPAAHAPEQHEGGGHPRR